MNITSAIQKLEDGTIKLTITIPANEVKKTWDEVVEETSKNAKISGFRKGKAPKKLVQENIDTDKVREEVLRKLLPQAYIEAVKQHNIKPIVNPKIHVEKLEEGKDWQFIALTCEAPEVKLENYKDVIQKITAKSKIVIPGKEQQPPNFDEIVKALLEQTTVTIPSLLTEHEVERLLSQTLDEVKKLGLTLDQYLSSTNRTPQSLREEYAKRAENDIKLEFGLQKIAETENITVEPKEIDEAIQKAKDETERKNLEANKYLLASILRQQKTLDFLRNL
ncbi:MAG: hypothetical protein HYV39_00770 [Candidatus Levybacteria bacterium]|nr:hypothetical protein [Candidatus Levybacteria bacterium]